jgi:viologen exporter family transport system permease protein
MPVWVQQIAWYLPFQWCFYYPIEALVGSMTPTELFTGLGMQLAWILIGLLGVNIVWKLGIRQFSAVGG